MKLPEGMRAAAARARAAAGRASARLEPVRAAAGRARARMAAHPVGAWLGRHWFVACAVLAFALTALATAYGSTCGFAGCPSTASIQTFRPSEGSLVLDRNGVTLGRLDYVRRVNVPLDSVPGLVREAFIAVEDRRFYAHSGIDWRSVLRASFRNIRSMGVAEGFSTITMQVVRNAFIPQLAGERSLRRKLIEIALARRLEENLTKDQILELYLNIIYLGNGVYGIEAASRDLFGKSVQKLTLAEAATLAALPKGPTSYSPRRNPERARARRDLVLGLMAEEGFITAEEAERARARAIRVRERGWYPKADASHALDPIRAAVDSILGDRADRLGDVVVHTTIDARAQRAAERAVRSRAAQIERAAESGRRREGEVEGAMVAVDPRTGAIRALVGGNNYERGAFNRAFGARRQPGSAFKPFVYAAALGAGLSPATVVDDVPLEMELPDGDLWAPENFGGEYSGPVTLRRALMRSANAATIRLAEQVGRRRVIATAVAAGITSPLPDVPALSLGSAEVTPLELVLAYAPFANGGFRVNPRLVERIERPDGDSVWQADSAVLVRALDPRDAFQVTSMLQSVVDQGTGYEIRRLGVRGPVAGKTGTTNDGNDVWFVGFTPTLVAGFWFGYDVPRSLGYGATGGRLAAPAWVDFYKGTWRDDDGTGWPEPPGLIAKTIDSYNGMLANEYCPTVHREWFRVGTEPARVCDEHHASFWDSIESLGDKVGDAVKRILGF
jgi:1A family penicillin-binding protein